MSDVGDFILGGLYKKIYGEEPPKPPLQVRIAGGDDGHTTYTDKPSKAKLEAELIKQFQKDGANILADLRAQQQKLHQTQDKERNTNNPSASN